MSFLALWLLLKYLLKKLALNKGMSSHALGEFRPSKAVQWNNIDCFQIFWRQQPSWNKEKWKMFLFLLIPTDMIFQFRRLRKLDTLTAEPLAFTDVPWQMYTTQNPGDRPRVFDNDV